MVVGLDYIMDFHDVWMVKQLKDLDFPPDRFLSLRLLDLVLFVDFNSYLFVGRFVNGNSHRGICSLPNDLTY